MLLPMKNSTLVLSYCLASAGLILALASSSQAAVVTMVEPPTTANTLPVEYTHDGHALLGHLSIPQEEGGDGPFPAVIIVPDWDGVNDMEQIRATMVTEEWGFIGFAADIYGANMQTVDNITDRIELVTAYRSDPALFAGRIQAAIDLVKDHEKVDADRVALFGYCFGGTGVLQYGLLGMSDVVAVVSFHGGLGLTPEPNATFEPKVLILSGGDDDTSTEVMDMEVTLDVATAPWEITRYSGIQHAFTVWTDERYNAWADQRSWESAGLFLLEAFGLVEYTSAQPDEVSVTAVNYTGDDGQELTGFLAMPGDDWIRPLPAVVIFPDWDGNNQYEKERATALAALGYVAFAGDIYGSDKLEVEDFSERIELVTQYSSDPGLYISRMQNAIDQVKALTEDVDSGEISVIGYCFGGSGVVLYSLSGGSDAKVAVPFHGSFQSLPPVQGNVSAYLLVLSGGDDDAHGNQTVMETTFEEGGAGWEITRYAGVLHGFTNFESADAYNLVADARSWESMRSAFAELMAVPQKADAGNDTSPPADTTSDNGDSSANAHRHLAGVVAVAAFALVFVGGVL